MTAAALPNLLLIVVDQWRGDWMPGVVHPTGRLPQLPSLERLMREGTTFRRQPLRAGPGVAADRHVCHEPSGHPEPGADGG